MNALSQTIRLILATLYTVLTLPLCLDPQSVILFEDGQCLLVSEYEADQIIGRVWEASSSTTKTCLISLVNFAYIRHLPGSSTAAPCLQLPQITKPVPDELTLTALQLFAGDTLYTTPERKEALRELVSNPKARQAALRPAALHGLQSMVSRSDLEQICQADAGEL